MGPVRRILLVLVPPVVLTAAVLGWQRRTAVELQERVARQRAATAELARLQKENQRLLAAQPTEAEVVDLLARQGLVQNLQAQRAALHRKEEQADRTAATESEATSELISLKGNSVDFRLWRNVGQATPEAALQTALWAAATGNLDALTGVLMLDEQARSQAAAAFDRLPAPLRGELGTPERLIAFLTAMDVPLGRASISGEAATPGGMKVTSQLTDAEGRSKAALFTLQSVDERWRLQVPAEAVRKYAGWLQAPGGKSPSGK